MSIPLQAGAGRPRRLILGLGNPGERYRETRHNVGFQVIRKLAGRRGLELNRLECNSLLGEDDEVILALPQTFMNRSGHAARCLVERRQLEPEGVMVVYDEIQLPLGRLRLRPSGGPGGHRGMESVIRSLQSERVPRLRLGIGDPGSSDEEDLVDFVLSPFRREERRGAEVMIELAVEACLMWLEVGLEATMNRYNA